MFSELLHPGRFNVMATVSVPFHENQPIVLHLLQVILQKPMCWLDITHYRADGKLTCDISACATAVKS